MAPPFAGRAEAGQRRKLLGRQETRFLPGPGLGKAAGMSQADGFQDGGAQGAQASQAAAASQPQQQQQAEQFVDRIVKQRLEQAFSNMFGKLVESSERAAKAAEQQAGSQRSDNLVRSLKVDVWKPQSREEELKTWREWYFNLTNYLAAHDAGYEEDLKQIDLDTEVDHALLPDEMAQRSLKLYSLLCSLLKGRPLLLVRALDRSKSGYEAVRLLRAEMEPREKARSLALLRQLAAWRFEGQGGLHEQLIKYEEALRAYESASGKEFSKDLVLATVLTGLKEPLRSQVQFRMTPATTYAELREWILQYESLNTPWGMVGPGQKTGGTKYDDSGHQPMDVDRVWAGKGGKYGKYGKGSKDGKGKGKDSKGKGKDGKGKTKDGKGKGGKTKDGKGQGQDRWSVWAGNSWNDPEACRICGKRGEGPLEVGVSPGKGQEQQGSRKREGAAGRAAAATFVFVFGGPLNRVYHIAPVSLSVPRERFSECGRGVCVNTPRLPRDRGL